jgi:hypothetical protein
MLLGVVLGRLKGGLPAREPIVYKMWESRHLTTLRASTTSYMDSLASFLYVVERNKCKYSLQN